MNPEINKKLTKPSLFNQLTPLSKSFTKIDLQKTISTKAISTKAPLEISPIIQSTVTSSQIVQSRSSISIRRRILESTENQQTSTENQQTSIENQQTSQLNSKRCRCGSTTHRYTNHRECLLNPKISNEKNTNKKPRLIFQPENPQITNISTDNVDSNAKLCPTCGLTDHQRSSSLKCPFNSKNQNNIDESTHRYSFYMVARKEFHIDLIFGPHIVNDKGSDNYKRHVFPKRSTVCPHCHALMWFNEKLVNSSIKNPEFGLCCLSGSVQIPQMPPCPHELLKLLTGKESRNKSFRDNIRLYNSLLSFTSSKADIDKSLIEGKGTYVFRINGAIHHYIGSYMPYDNDPKFAQIYIYDPVMQLDIRYNKFNHLDQNILKVLQEMLHKTNPYVKIYQNVGQQIKEYPNKELTIQFLNRKIKTDKTFNLPTCDEIAVLIGENTEEDTQYQKGNLVCQKSGKLQLINSNISHYDPLHYPLIFPYGQPGWQIKTFPKTMKKESQEPNFVTQREFYSYMLHDRKDSFLQLFGRLYHEYIVDQYSKIELNRLNYISTSQQEARTEVLQGMVDAINQDELISIHNIGRRIILPSSFTNGPRYMAQLYQDAMSVVRALGKPDLFITFTCNPFWPEITSELKETQQPTDRPDLVARVFNIKVKELLKDLIDNKIFGQVIGNIYVIEFQKRGLPHVHILLILHERDKPTTIEQINRIVSAEIPDPIKEPLTYATVQKCMIHTCSDRCTSKENPKCSKGFPKSFSEETVLNNDSYPIYRRRSNGHKIIKDKRIIGNEWVVPYNRYLTTKYNAHINVEVCNAITAVKYLYKYVYKGLDKVQYNLNIINSETEANNKDEIKQYLAARYVSASEACWRIFGFKTNDQFPLTVRLPVHIEGQQTITFKISKSQNEANEEEEIKKLINDKQNTQLTEFFYLNQIDSFARQLLYHEIPKFYTWNTSEKKWKKRSKPNETIIGRMYFVHPRELERHALRILLLYRRGSTSFQDLRTVNGVVHESFREAAYKLGFLKDDNEWDIALKEASSTITNIDSLRDLFCVILIHCQPSNPLYLWKTHVEAFCTDIKYKYNGDIERYSISQIHQYCLYLIDIKLNKYGKSLKDFTSLPAYSLEIIQMFEVNQLNKSDLISQELDYDLSELNKNYEDNIKKLNKDQETIFTQITARLESNEYNNNIYFLDGPGGTGKTFLYQCLLGHVRRNKQIALAVASSGIAALLLDGGRTAHSRFHIPIELLSTSTCNIKTISPEAELIRSCKLIIWDEAPMVHRHAIEAVDRTFRDIMKNIDINHASIPFGNKVILFGGDFRQILPVLKKGSRYDIVNASINRSKLWKHVLIYKLTINMRIMRNPHPGAKEFADYLLKLGEGREISTIDADGTPDFIEIPEYMIFKKKTKEEFIKEVFPTIEKGYDQSMINKAILTTTNEKVDDFNSISTNIFPGQEFVFLSTDYLLADSQTVNFPTELLNSLSVSGLPPHKLILKSGMPIMLLRNLSSHQGLCNGTRLICRNFYNKVIEAEVVSGNMAGNIVFIPRIPMVPTDSGLPFDFARLQFPVRPAFAMTINKSQGQTLDFVGLWLNEPAFSHGQLYVSLSRVSNSKHISIALPENKTQTRNVVYNEVFNS